MAFRLINPRDPLRPSVEAAIRDVYWREYGAAIDGFPPLLVAAYDAEGNLQAAAGLRFASTSFFSECYLDAPVEEVLSRASGTRVGRSQIVEITSLAAIRPGASMALIRHIVAFARQNSITWAFFTATERLRALLRRSLVPAMDLVAAQPERVTRPERWGTYYQTAPRVTAISDAMVPAFAADTQTAGVAVHA